MNSSTRPCLPVMAALVGSVLGVAACDLCAINNSALLPTVTMLPFQFTVAEQFVARGTPQLDGVATANPGGDFLDTSITHFIPGWNPVPEFGLSLNVPFIHRRYRTTEFVDGGGFLVPQQGGGTVSGLGDISLILRWSPWRHRDEDWSGSFHVLGGVKLPTGETGRLADYVSLARIYDGLFPPGHNHDADPIAGAVHPAELSPGSGSVDGIFGLAGEVATGRWFLRGDAQYYLRTGGESGYRFGDEMLLSLRPGAALAKARDWSLALQLNTTFEWRGRDSLLGRTATHMGWSQWLVGPELTWRWKNSLQVQAGIDLPVSVENNGFQLVQDYRINARFVWRF